MKLFFKVDKKQRKRGRHSRKRHHFWHRVREWLWPSIGGRAFFRFMEIKVKRTNDSVHSIALGLAIGSFISFTPYMGLHGVIALVICFFTKANYIMGLLGTLLGNPWTFPVIWLWTYNVGNSMLGREKAPNFPEQFHPNIIFENISYYFDVYLWPMTISGVPSGILFGIAVYFLVYFNLSSYRRARQKYLNQQRKKYLNLKTAAMAIKEKISEKIPQKSNNGSKK